MSRRMSVSMTLDAVRNQTKFVTRRHVDTWKNLKPGDRLTLIEKGMGLPKGAKQVVVCEVEVVSVAIEDIGFVDRNECAREGFPEMTPREFIRFWLKGHGYQPETDGVLHCSVPCRRIEWRYLSAPFPCNGGETPGTDRELMDRASTASVAPGTQEGRQGAELETGRAGAPS